MPGPRDFSSGISRISLEVRELWELNPPIELFGHVTLVQGYVQPPDFVGCHAIVALRDTPGKEAAVLTPEWRLQSLLETALDTGKIAFEGQEKDTNTPRVDGRRRLQHHKRNPLLV